MTGTIRTLRVDKGFGFIKDDGGKEYFFHQSAVYGEGLDNLREGDSVEFDVGEGPKGPRAENVRRTSTARGETPAAFGRRCIPAGCVAPRSNTPGILARRALPSGRIAALGATLEFHHGLLDKPCLNSFSSVDVSASMRRVLCGPLSPAPQRVRTLREASR
ncbi:MAG: hypothetical protein DMF97_01990 [Acidobacteria bacterium]|nr:MAG: hypothetical protein DMF97_01990 [Acidobacteriota bacterium]